MKEIALPGTASRIFGDVLGQLLNPGLSVNAFVDEPEKIMLDDSRLTVSHLDVTDETKSREAFAGYDTAVLVYNDDLRDARTNELTLKTFTRTVHAAREAGVKRVIVVGSENSEAFFVTDLRRLDDIDWLFVSNVGPYAKRVRKEIEKPTRHNCVYEA